MSLNVHKVFKKGLLRQGFEGATEVHSDEEKLLYRARGEIRRQLKGNFDTLWDRKRPSDIVVPAVFQEFHKMWRSELPLIRPKFLTQGSFAYDTANWPCHQPIQQVDLDDGMYLAMPYLAGQPVIEPAQLREEVKGALMELCSGRGWGLREKSSCFRIQPGTENSHIDVTSYGVPLGEFSSFEEELRKTRVALGIDTRPISSAQIRSLLKSGAIGSIQSDLIMLATRDEGWIESDPKKLNDWFNNEVERFGDQLRRVCRYLKAWRDFQWKTDSCGLSSIAIMTLVSQAYNDPTFKCPPSDRDDLALLRVTEYMLNALNGPVANPQISVPLDVHWGGERADFVATTNRLHEELVGAIDHGSHKDVALARVTRAFGRRIPNDTSLIVRTPDSDDVRSIAPAIVASPHVGKMTSG